jgi:hypothetical protein
MRDLQLNFLFDLGRHVPMRFVEVNAKNSFGGYTGIVLVAVYFKDGKVFDVATLHGGR